MSKNGEPENITGLFLTLTEKTHQRSLIIPLQHSNILQNVGMLTM